MVWVPGAGVPAGAGELDVGVPGAVGVPGVGVPAGAGVEFVDIEVFPDM